jgi:hypothetical protein
MGNPLENLSGDYPTSLVNTISAHYYIVLTTSEKYLLYTKIFKKL